MNEGEWLDEFVDWLDGFPWQWFCTLTSRPGLSPPQIRWRLQRWAKELGEALGTEQFEWVGVPENGTSGMHFHFHVLIAGLKKGCGAAERLDWMRRWCKLAGDAQIEDYKSDGGGVRYILKHVEPGDMDRIEIHLVTGTKMQSDLKSTNHEGGTKTSSEGREKNEI